MILGIDPGLHGGWSLINESAHLVRCGVFPINTQPKTNKLTLDGPTLAALLSSTNAKHAYVENVHSRPRQAGQFQFGINCGIVHGILYASRIPFTLVAPASWKAQFGIRRGEDETKADKKSEARSIAASLYPDKAHHFARVKDDGVAEATLLAIYGLYLYSTT